MKVEYPKWMYHRTEAPVIVDDPDEREALGDGWAETPAAFELPVAFEPRDGGDTVTASGESPAIGEDGAMSEGVITTAEEPLIVAELKGRRRK